MDGEWRWEEHPHLRRQWRHRHCGHKPTDFAAPCPGANIAEIADGMTPVSMDFSAGYYYGDTSKADTPDTLKVALDTTDAKSGDTVNVKIEARYAGKATVQVVGDRLLSSQTIDVPEGGLTLPIKVGSDWGTGAYVLASLYKPMDVKAKRMPSRAMGLAWFGIDRASRTLGIKLTPPEMMKPRQKLTVPVKVENLSPGEEAFITLAAVDVGPQRATILPRPKLYFDRSA
jgi:hypothetical protein